MQSFEEFVAEAELEEAKRQDKGLGYNLGEGILRALHNRIARLEPAEPEPEPQPVQPQPVPPVPPVPPEPEQPQLS